MFKLDQLEVRFGPLEDIGGRAHVLQVTPVRDGEWPELDTAELDTAELDSASVDATGYAQEA